MIVIKHKWKLRYKEIWYLWKPNVHYRLVKSPPVFLRFATQVSAHALIFLLKNTI